MNNLELEFLFNLDFRLHVNTEVYAEYCQQFERVGSGLPENWLNEFQITLRAA